MSLDLRADCARCAALCCVAFHFDRSDDFGVDKAAGRPCPHLSKAGRCGVYAQRAENGFGGCVGYDCHGAGQRVTQQLFGGQSWLEDPSLLAAMAAAFLVMERAHRLLWILREAENLDLCPTDRRAVHGFARSLEQAASNAQLVGALEAQVGRRLRRFRSYMAIKR